MLTTIILHDNGIDIIKVTPEEKENYRLKNRLLELNNIIEIIMNLLYLVKMMLMMYCKIKVTHDDIT